MTVPTFLLDPSLTFLNHGSFGATPMELLDIQQALRRELERSPVSFLVRELPQRLEAARAPVAELLNADPEGLCFVRNSTEAINAIASCAALGPGDEILTTEHRYNAVWRTLERVARRAGATLRAAPLPFPADSPEALADAVIAAIRPQTRLLVVDWITSTSALVLPVHAIATAARARGVRVLIDGAHAPGQVDVDLRALDADWFVGNLHKWLCAPKGAAVLWTRTDLRHSTLPVVTSHGESYREAFDWPGTFDPTPWLCAPAAVALHESMGGESLRADHHALVRQGIARVCDAVGVPLAHADDARLYAAMAAIPLPLPEAAALPLREHLFDAHRIEVPLQGLNGAAWLRVSAFAAYNDAADYERLADVLPNAIRWSAARISAGPAVSAR